MTRSNIGVAVFLGVMFVALCGADGWNDNSTSGKIAHLENEIAQLRFEIETLRRMPATSGTATLEQQRFNDWVLQFSEFVKKEATHEFGARLELENIVADLAKTQALSGVLTQWLVDGTNGGEELQNEARETLDRAMASGRRIDALIELEKKRIETGSSIRTSQ
jgi:hypothetical protein